MAGSSDCPLAVDVHRDDLSARVVLSGDVDLVSARDVQVAFDDIFEAGTGQLTVDLTDVTFMDSSGLQVLLHAERVAREARVGFAVRGASGPVARLFKLTGVDVMPGFAVS